MLPSIDLKALELFPAFLDDHDGCCKSASEFFILCQNVNDADHGNGNQKTFHRTPKTLRGFPEQKQTETCLGFMGATWHNGKHSGFAPSGPGIDSRRSQAIFFS